MKKKLTNNFDAIAPVYDAMSRMVYLNAQRCAQTDQLDYLSKDHRILIVGGGTGWILESIAKRYESGLQIVYIEISENMLELARKRDCKNNHVEFIHSAIENYTAHTPFDIIITPFLFDNFSVALAQKVFNELDVLLKPGGLWFSSDFTLDKKYGRWWKKLLAKSMYFFFKTFGMVEGNSFNDMRPLFLSHQYTVERENFYYGHFIKGTVYRKAKA